MSKLKTEWNEKMFKYLGYMVTEDEEQLKAFNRCIKAIIQSETYKKSTTSHKIKCITIKSSTFHGIDCLESEKQYGFFRSDADRRPGWCYWIDKDAAKRMYNLFLNESELE
jgi:hypothetical protein